MSRHGRYNGALAERVLSQTGDKTKWIPIKADITVNASRTFNTSEAKRTKASAGARKDVSGAASGEGSSAAGTSTAPTGRTTERSSDAAHGKASAKDTSSKASGKAATMSNAGKASSSAQSTATNKVTAASAHPSSSDQPHPLPAKPVSTAQNHQSNKANQTSTARSSAGTASQPQQQSKQTQSTSPSTLATPAPAAVSSPVPQPPAQSQSHPMTNGGHTPMANGHGHGSSFRGGAPRGGAAGRGGGLVRGRGGVAGGRGGAARGGGAGPHHGIGHQQQPALPMAQSHPFPVFMDHAAPVFDPHQRQQQFGMTSVDPFSAATGAYGVPPQPVDPRVLDPTRYWLLGQLEWWFSVDNLCRDLFLRSKVSGRLQSVPSIRELIIPASDFEQMDAAGWIDISLIASFNRIKNLTTDQAIVRDTMCFTPLLEVVDDYVRLRQHWPDWVLPNAVPSRVSEDRMAAARAGVMGQMHAPAQTQTHDGASSVASSSDVAALLKKDDRDSAHGHDGTGHASSEDEDGGEGTAATSMSGEGESERDGAHGETKAVEAGEPDLGAWHDVQRRLTAHFSHDRLQLRRAPVLRCDSLDRTDSSSLQLSAFPYISGSSYSSSSSSSSKHTDARR